MTAPAPRPGDTPPDAPGETPAARPRRTASLAIVMGTVFAAILVALSAALVAMNYATVADLGRREAATRFDQVAGDVRSTLAAEISLIDTVLDTASLTVETDIPKTELGTLLLRMLLDMRAGASAVTGVEIGAADGSMVLVRALPEVRPVDAPDEAEFEIAIVAPHPDGHSAPVTETRQFVDATGRVIATMPPGPARFDPRTRPWYKAGISNPDVRVIPPYLFAGSNILGVSLVRASRIEPGVVLAVDATLSDLDELLRRLRTSPEMELVAFLRSGLLISHADGDLLRLPGAQPPNIDETGSPLRTALLRIARTEPLNTLRDLTVDNERYLALVSPATATLPQMLVGIAYPYDRVLGDAGRARRDGLIVSAVALALTLVAVVLAARRIARPLTLLTTRMRRIMALKFTGRPPPSSAIREIGELSTALGTMEVALATFARYVPSQIVRGIVTRHLSTDLGGQRKPVTVLFTDVTGFSTIAETLTPEEVMIRTGRYFGELGRPLMAGGATIDKYIGDSIMAFWNAPGDQPDHAALACRAVLAAAEKIDALNLQLVAEGAVPMLTRFGLHTGEAIVGNIGSADRMNYTVLGHTVNIAARLEGLNKTYGTRILVTESVRVAAGPGFRFRHVDTIAPRGTREAIRIHELQGIEPGT